MKPTIILTLAILLSCTVSRGEDNPKPEPYELKNRSSFGMDKEARAPFWPIGWQRRKDGGAEPAIKVAKAVANEPAFRISGDSFNVTSVLLGNPSLATINGRSFEEGEYLPVTAEGKRLKIQVRAIREQGVWLQHDSDQPILVPMRRTELRPKTPALQDAQKEWTIQLTRK